MRFRVFLFTVLAWAGCGSGGGSSSDGSPTLSAAPQTMVVQYDHNGDGELDFLTLDVSEAPFRILELLEGVSDGAPVDKSALFQGQAIDPAISQALADHLASSFNLGERVELNVGTKLVVFE